VPADEPGVLQDVLQAFLVTVHSATASARTRSRRGRVEAVVEADIHRATEQFLKVEGQATEIEEAAVFVHVDDEVEIAVVVLLTAGHGPEDPHVARPVRAGDGQDLLAAPSELLHPGRGAAVAPACRQRPHLRLLPRNWRPHDQPHHRRFGSLRGRRRPLPRTAATSMLWVP
jgi:hypothetical protein